VAAEDPVLLIATYDAVFGTLKEAIDKGSLMQLLFTKPLEPLFRVR
jgi:hypothetical protein